MSRVDSKKKLRPSVLDRLLDNEPHNQAELDPGHHQQLKQLRESIKRDLECLFNTRVHIMKPPDELHELDHSLLNYGIPDLATVNINDVVQRDEFTSRLEQTLRMFEPRFKSVKVSFNNNIDSADRTLRFRIDAIMYADPLPETIVFDSVMESVTRTVTVNEVSHG